MKIKLDLKFDQILLYLHTFFFEYIIINHTKWHFIQAYFNHETNKIIFWWNYVLLIILSIKKWRIYPVLLFLFYWTVELSMEANPEDNNSNLKFEHQKKNVESYRSLVKKAEARQYQQQEDDLKSKFIFERPQLQCPLGH